MKRELRERMRARILRNVTIEPDTGCWIWERRRANSGYGVITCRLDGYETPRPLFAHRVSYEAFKRGIPLGLVVAHHPKLCSSRACVNPQHLRATTASENRKDVDRAARHRARAARELDTLRYVPRPKHRITRELAAA